MSQEEAPTVDTHVFVGMFRPPRDQVAVNPYVDPVTGEKTWIGVFVCPNGHHAHYVESVNDCWQKGCYDTPVYKTIEEVIRIRGGL